MLRRWPGAGWGAQVPGIRPEVQVKPAGTGCKSGSKQITVVPGDRVSAGQTVPNTDGAPGRNRTSDTRFRKPLLYPLSYEGGGCRKGGRKPA
jgi:hypothetical protein